MTEKTRILLDHLRFFGETDDAFFILPTASRHDAVEVLRVIGFLGENWSNRIH